MRAAIWTLVLVCSSLAAAQGGWNLKPAVKPTPPTQHPTAHTPPPPPPSAPPNAEEIRKLAGRIDDALKAMREERAMLQAELKRIEAVVGAGTDGPSADQRAEAAHLATQLAELEGKASSIKRAVAEGLDPALVTEPLSALESDIAASRQAMSELEKTTPAADLTALVERLNARVAELEARPVAVASAPVAPAVAVEPAPVSWFQRIKLEGLAEAYYSYRFQGSPSDKTNELRAFDTYNNTFTPSFGKLGFSLAPKPAGFHLDLAFGPVADLGAPDLSSPGAEVFKHLLQAYASVKLFDLLTIDFGKFVTSAGAEVFENNGNWLSSRSMIFAYGPYTHSGVRASAVLNEVFTVQASVVNGWDTILTAGSWKTFNVSVLMNVGDTSLAFNFYGGPQSTPAVRWLFDAVATQKFGEHFALNLNAIYGAEADAKWYAASLQGKYTIGERVRLAARVEYFGDPDGHRTGRSNAMYLDTTVGAGVIVLNDDAFGGVEIRPEFRHDQFIGPDMFAMGGGGANLPAVQINGPVHPFAGGTSDSQTTLSVTMVAWF